MTGQLWWRREARIAHVTLDVMFAAVEQRGKVSQRGWPVIEGRRIEICPVGHTLLSRKPAQPYRFEQRTARMRGHERTVCPN